MARCGVHSRVANITCGSASLHNTPVTTSGVPNAVSADTGIYAVGFVCCAEARSLVRSAPRVLHVLLYWPYIKLHLPGFVRWYCGYWCLTQFMALVPLCLASHSCLFAKRLCIAVMSVICTLNCIHAGSCVRRSGRVPGTGPSPTRQLPGRAEQEQGSQQAAGSDKPCWDASILSARRMRSAHRLCLRLVGSGTSGLTAG